MKQRLGDVLFDPASGELRHGDAVARLAPQPASLLELLATRRGTVVGRDEIRRHLWPEGKVEFEQGIAFAVREIRKTLEAIDADPGLIETIPKRGFRFRTPETVAEPWGATGGGGDGKPGRERGAGADDPQRADGAAAGRTGTGTRTAFTLGALVLFVATAVVLTLRAGTLDRPVLALFAHDVVPGSGDGSLSLAIARELTTELARELRGEAGVVGPTGTASLDGPDDTDGARSTLGACLVLSGGLRATGEDVVVFTQIVRTHDRVHVWARQDTVSVTDAGPAVVPAIVEGARQALGDC